jgi:hypothetical protein
MVFVVFPSARTPKYSTCGLSANLPPLLSDVSAPAGAECKRIVRVAHSSEENLAEWREFGPMTIGKARAKRVRPGGPPRSYDSGVIQGEIADRFEPVVDTPGHRAAAAVRREAEAFDNNPRIAHGDVGPESVLGVATVARTEKANAATISFFIFRVSPTPAGLRWKKARASHAGK